MMMMVMMAMMMTVLVPRWLVLSTHSPFLFWTSHLSARPSNSADRGESADHRGVQRKTCRIDGGMLQIRGKGKTLEEIKWMKTEIFWKEALLEETEYFRAFSTSMATYWEGKIAYGPLSTLRWPMSCLRFEMSREFNAVGFMWHIRLVCSCWLKKGEGTAFVSVL